MKIALVAASLVAAAIAGSASARKSAPLLVVSSDPKWSDDHVFAYRPGGRVRACALGSGGSASPDGRLVAFVRDGVLWTVGPDGRGTRRVVSLGEQPRAGVLFLFTSGRTAEAAFAPTSARAR